VIRGISYNKMSLLIDQLSLDMESCRTGITAVKNVTPTPVMRSDVVEKKAAELVAAVGSAVAVSVPIGTYVYMYICI
jgi:hypothetical protein